MKAKTNGKLRTVQSKGEIKDGGTAFCYQSECQGLECWCCSRNHECFPVDQDCTHNCVYEI